MYLSFSTQMLDEFSYIQSSLALAGFTNGVEVKTFDYVTEGLHGWEPVRVIPQGAILYKYTGIKINQNVNF